MPMREGEVGQFLGYEDFAGELCRVTQGEYCLIRSPEPVIDTKTAHYCADDASWFCSCGAVVDDGSADDWRKTWQKTTVGDCPTCGRVHREWFFYGHWQTTETKKEGHK